MQSRDSKICKIASIFFVFLCFLCTSSYLCSVNNNTIIQTVFIANELRKKNIAEYLLYMWQVEDTIRAFDCSLPRIRKEYVSRFDYTDEQRDELIDWYGNLIRMMNEEGCRQQGHLQINRVTLQLLTELHQQLLQSPQYPFYNTAYYKVLPFIVELRSRGADKTEGEIETCLNLLYGVMILRLQNKDISASTQHAVQEVSNFIGMLADYYKKDKEEGLKF